MKKIREAAKRDPSLRENVEASIKLVLDLISNRFSQLKYSGNYTKIEAPAAQDDYESSFVELFSSIFHVEAEVVEQSFACISEGTITILQVLKDFMAKHCDAKRYSFQIRKCSEETCAYCSINLLPVPNEVFNSLHFFPYALLDPSSQKYKTFDQTYGKGRTDTNRPALTSKPGKPKADLKNHNLLVAGVFFFSNS